ncbi:exodeoxyribonuclease VII large subunit [Ponticoccus alexandrii]|uniref:Exodeoxyribonuclease 7 large subunit n=1 Tax=Ponticoccus alexandrii TaxID=1943633 RepID=A0ABX7FBA7_9RHOB|nr:exodeoxyribonuclease VII large subunit [Ponticoccus alexandrii]ETA52232.2 exodeoxyribonuclease VII large subunit [Rhodobacteraceae bacterium PD-2]QRF67141.1 exodeoxyribonuclease VII large subunit [Ponticoccus alexandrii]
MDLLDDEPGNTPEFTVSELSGAVKRTIEGEFGFVRVRGELGRVTVPRSGHVYLDLKDDRSVIAGIVWKGVAAKLPMRPEEGMEVVVTGRMTTFPGQSKYQIVIEDMAPAGAGALMAMLEKRKAQLQAEGLFDPARKRPLPYLPEVIGVVTSPSGAVIRDILHRLRDRFPRKVLIWPVAVQGAKSAAEVARGIEGFNRMTPGGALPRPDLLIVARGGGSVEDLWGFNEEIVVRAAAASEIPLISAVGHETDTTLIDFASDRRAPTPTAAAELAVPVRLELLAATRDFGTRMTRAMGHRLEVRGQRLRDVARALPRPEELLDGPRQRLDHLEERLPGALRRAVDRKRLILTEQAGSLRPATLRRAIATERARAEDRAGRLAPALGRLVAAKREALARRADRLDLRPLRRDVATGRDRLADLSRRLDAAQGARVADLTARVEALDRLRETLGYRATLARGYTVVRGEGQVLTSKAQAEAATGLEIEFADGRLKLGGGPARRAAPAAKAKPPEQGSLF